MARELKKVARQLDKSAWVLLICIFIIRLFASLLPAFEIDMTAWIAWASRLAALGPARFYSDQIWTQYTPGFLYWLWFLAKLNLANELAIKLTVLAADFLTGFLLWRVTQNRRAFVFYVLNPAVVFTGAVWGQIDGILTLFLFLAVYFLVFKKQLLRAVFFWTIAFLVKPQAIALLPILVFYGLKNFKLAKILLGSLVFLLTLYLFSLSFFPQNHVFGLASLIQKMSNYYAYTSVFAFNFWSLVGMWRADTLTFGGISYFHWGFILYLAALVLIFTSCKNKITKKENIFLMAALLFLAFFLFPTRVHERYLFPALAFLLAAGQRKLFWLTSFLLLINLYHPYAYYGDNFLVRPFLLNLTGQIAPFVAVGYLLIFGRVLLNAKK
jgi:Gpi18-like mannosyltransferase